MKISEISQQLDEVGVFSSWISDLSLAGNGDVIMSLLSGRRYVVSGIGEDLFTQWVNAPSKGVFWHSNIKNIYSVTRA